MRKRNVQKSIYLSEKENIALQKKCKEFNLDCSNTIRQLLDNYEPIKVDVNILTNHSDELNQIGNNLNKIAKDMYRYGYIDERKYRLNIEQLNYIMEDIKFNLGITR